MSVKKGKKLKISFVKAKSKPAGGVGGWLNGITSDSRSAAAKNAGFIAMNRRGTNTAVRIVQFPVKQYDGEIRQKFLVQFKRTPVKWQ